LLALILAFSSYLKRGSVLLRRFGGAILRKGHKIAVVFLLGAVVHDAYSAEHVAVLELGGAGEWGLTDPASHYGPTLAVEVTPIEHWLELEFGVTAFRSHSATEWETDLLFKKPYQLSRTVEFMAGLGPAWSHSSSAGERANSVSAEFVLDFMFWPKERWGWYLEPSYGYGFDHEHSRSLGLSAGLLIGVP
jgi:hypothetical protein